MGRPLRRRRRQHTALTLSLWSRGPQVAEEVLWRRIKDRLQREPGRAKYNEVRGRAAAALRRPSRGERPRARGFRQGKRSWMEQTLEFYNTFKWDLVRVARGGLWAKSRRSRRFALHLSPFQHVENNEDPIEKVQEQLVSIMCRASPRFEVGVPANGPPASSAPVPCAGATRLTRALVGTGAHRARCAAGGTWSGTSPSSGSACLGGSHGRALARRPDRAGTQSAPAPGRSAPSGRRPRRRRPSWPPL